MQQVLLSPLFAETAASQITPNSNDGPNPKTEPLTPKVQILTQSPHQHQNLNTNLPELQQHHSQLPTPVKWEMLQYWLTEYPKDKADFLISGFKYGFKLCYEGPRGSQTSPNLKSALDKPDIVREKIAAELHAGHISGPHRVKPFKNFKVSPLGIMLKKN